MKRLIDEAVEHLFRAADWFEVEVPSVDPAIPLAVLEVSFAFSIFLLLFALVGCV